MSSATTWSSNSTHTSSPGAQAASPAQRLSAIEKHFQLSLFLLLLVSVLTLVSTGKLEAVSVLLAPAALAVKGYRWLRGCPPELSPRAATWLVVSYFAFFPADLFWISRILAADAQNPLLFSALLAAIHLMLFALVVRLYSASTTRDYLFLALLALGGMLVSAILTVDTAFLVFFFVFLVLAVSTFVGLEMLRSAEGTTSPAIESGTGPARRLHAALGTTSGAIALGALVAGAGIFVILPRFSAGYLSRFDLQPTLMTGFTDNVELGQIGEIKKSSAVVMRIQVEGDPATAHNMHWRGVALTTFDGKRWYTEEHDLAAADEAADGWMHLREKSPLPKQFAAPLRYSILLEPIASDALFAAAEPVELRGQFAGDTTPGGRLFRRSYVMVDKTGSLSNPFHNFANLKYDAVSAVPRVPADLLRAAGDSYDAATRNLYLQLPKLDPRIPDLAKQITAGARNPYDQAHSIEQYLRTHYGYTLDLTGPPPADPVAYFLFDKRAGHCEYFAAAMTVMLRSVGVPARYVNGFLPGEYNSIGSDYIVRGSDAHSWVEVFFPGYGWITFDPTPSNEGGGTGGLLARAALYWDWFQLQWSEWVINYDFLHQYTLAQNLQRASRTWTTDAGRKFDRVRNEGVAWIRNWQARLTATPAWPLIPMVLLVGTLGTLRSEKLRERLMLAWRLRKLGSTASLPPQAAALSYRRMLRLLERRGWRKRPGQTALEFAESLPVNEVRAPVLLLTELYLGARFGRRAADGRRFANLLGDLQAALRNAAS